MITADQIKQWAEEVLEGTDRFLVDVLVRNNDHIFVFLDADSTLTIDHCVEVSRHIESKLDRDEQDFELRVSSAGLDHPIKMLRQIRKNIGRSLEIELIDGNIINAKLMEVNDSDLILETFITKKQSKIKKTETGSVIKLPFEQIKETRIIVSFK
jgi:ribosome maturation factor RimP